MSPTNSTSRYAALRISLRVAFGWAFLMLICQGISKFWSLSPRDKLSEAFVMSLIFLGSYVIYGPRPRARVRNGWGELVAVIYPAY